MLALLSLLAIFAAGAVILAGAFAIPSEGCLTGAFRGGTTKP